MEGGPQAAPDGALSALSGQMEPHGTPTGTTMDIGGIGMETNPSRRHVLPRIVCRLLHIQQNLYDHELSKRFVVAHPENDQVKQRGGGTLSSTKERERERERNASLFPVCTHTQDTRCLCPRGGTNKKKGGHPNKKKAAAMLARGVSSLWDFCGPGMPSTTMSLSRFAGRSVASLFETGRPCWGFVEKEQVCTAIVFCHSPGCLPPQGETALVPNTMIKLDAHGAHRALKEYHPRRHLSPRHFHLFHQETRAAMP